MKIAILTVLVVVSITAGASAQGVNDYTGPPARAPVSAPLPTNTTRPVVNRGPAPPINLGVRRPARMYRAPGSFRARR